MTRLILFFLLLPFASSWAQPRTVRGLVTESSGEPLLGVTVVVEGTTRGTTTDPEGAFSLDLFPGEKSLVFSFIGFVTQTVDVTDKTEVTIVLLEDVTTLNELVVVGYGIQRKSDLTGSVSSLRGDDLTKIPSSSPEQALQGKVSGVQVTSTSGEPGAKPVVRIRGTGTFNNSAPIYVVDGVILDDISFLNSSDIESMELLKDASATAIYGSRGANGVILVTTKQGKAGQVVPRVNFGAMYGVQNLSNEIDLLSGQEFGEYVNEITPGTYNNLDVLPNTDWQDLVFEPAPVQNYELALSGGSEKSLYYVGLGYFNQQGIIDKSNYERFTLKLNNTFNPYSFLQVGNNITFSPTSKQFTANATYAAYRAQPVIEPYQADGSYSEVPGVGNPLADIEYTNSFERALRMVGSMYAQVAFLKSFTLKSSFGTDLDFREGRSFTPVFYVSPQQQNEINDLTVGNEEFITWLWENTLNYNRDFSNSRLSVLAGYTMQESTSEKLAASADNVIGSAENLWYLNPDNIDPTTIVNTVDPNFNYGLISYLFRINYTYDERYLFTATFRRDGSSKFNEENRWGNFPSFAAGWNIHRENFMAGNTPFSRLKLRGSWGQIGNEKISYLDQYALVENQISVVLGESEVLIPGASYGKNGNPNLKWETTTQLDFGVEAGVLNDKLRAEVDYYRRVTDDILVELSTPGYAGNGQGVKVRYNAGSVLNTGFDMSVGWNDAVGDFAYRVSAVGSTVHNEVLSVGGNSGVDSTLVGGFLGNGQSVTLSKEGLPIGAFFGYEIDGIFQNQNELDSYPHESLAEVGDLRYVDQNNDGVINSKDRVYIGSPIPTFIYGFSLGGEWKSFDLSMDFQGQLGNDLYNGKEQVRPDLYNFEQHVMDRWTGEGTSNTEPKASSGGTNYSTSIRFVQSGAFLRLRSATLTYRLPVSLARKMYMQDARIYLRGTNLFTLTEFTGYTPEIGSEDVLSNGIDKGTYPVTAIYSMGLNVSF